MATPERILRAEAGPEWTYEWLRKLLDSVRTLMNGGSLTTQMGLYPDQKMPQNQRNLTDVRTRMGTLLEYELPKAANELIQANGYNTGAFGYVIANKYPDLCFRTNENRQGIRFEVKAVETIAEEHSANFETLIKDIRKGSDFVVVMVWEWQQINETGVRVPEIDHLFLFDAWHIAHMQDCYWLNNPPNQIGDGRQGFDLVFGVNNRPDGYNKEEGNYGKLMRIFDPDLTELLPEEVQNGETLQTYFEFRDRTLRLGLRRIARRIAEGFTGDARGTVDQTFEAGAEITVARLDDGQCLLVLGDFDQPHKSRCAEVCRKQGCQAVVSLNKKFDWRARNPEGELLDKGNKPDPAVEWAQEYGIRLRT